MEGETLLSLSKGLGLTNSYPAHMANLLLTRCARTCYYLPMGSTATWQINPPRRSRQRPPQCSIPSQMRSISSHSCVKSSQIRTKTSQAPDRKRNKMERFFAQEPPARRPASAPWKLPPVAAKAIAYPNRRSLPPRTPTREPQDPPDQHLRRTLRSQRADSP